ncbi:type IV secretory pathway VirB9 component [Yersinia aldovae]|uniref:TrbG/VirB9 family P-type conjugative transfer protein n=1 Tax=Yersinia aldovae TaxID=29483 RepID=UPI0005E20241|nr:TrbG/VirB9 family P-type conjugative transfer protein [Yersinia aldovae]CNK25679.1 type IV secretory pathway VirB9 component [Yersinia aldovae]
MNKLVLSLFVSFILTASYNVAFAEINPQRTVYDSRIQTVMYNPDDVTRIRVKEGASTLIKLETDEYLTEDISGMGMGDPLAWNVSVRGNNIFLRPIAPEPDTNVTLVSNKRTYVFSLESVKAGMTPSWLVRFIYPEQPKNVFNQKPVLPCMTTGIINRKYQKQGNSSIAPISVWDDGRFTCFRFSHSSGLPSIYSVFPDGKEVLTNQHMKDDVVVIHEVATNFIIRLGNEVVAVRSNNVKSAGYNSKGTTTGETRQVIK